MFEVNDMIITQMYICVIFHKYMQFCRLKFYHVNQVVVVHAFTPGTWEAKQGKTKQNKNY